MQIGRIIDAWWLRARSLSLYVVGWIKEGPALRGI